MAQRATLILSLGLAAFACGEVDDAAPGELATGPGDVTKVDPGKADTSAEAVVVDMTFSAKLRSDQSWNVNGKIEDQLLYTIGQLNGSKAVGRLDKVILEGVDTQSVDGGWETKYTATLQVAWSRRNPVPETYTFRLPADISYAGQEAFTEAYGHSCVDWGAHDVDAGSMWYYYRPARSGCTLAPEDVVDAEAVVTVSDVNTTGKYPEYHRIWEDGTLRVVAVFGKYEDGATSGDAGISGYDKFHREIRNLLGSHDLQTEPVSVPSSPGVAHPDVTYSATLPDGRGVVVTALLVDNVRTAGREFDERYAALSGDADLIIYNGHAGLGANIRALARKGRWKAGQYAMVFLNGCDTYAYVDNAIFEAHADVNEDDPTGTKYADVLTNALPSFFASMAGATMALVRGLLAYEQPRTYEQIFRDIDSSQIILVTGEEDNEFVPGVDPDEPTPTTAPWEGVTMDGALGRDEEVRHETPTLPAGSYRFAITGDGDADLYVRVGLAPTTAEYDCRPYKSGSDEACDVELTTPAPIHVMVRGYATQSAFSLLGQGE